MTDQSAPETELAADQKPRKKTSDPIILAEPIVRGETSITEIVLRKPKAGELRGLSLQDLSRSEVSALITLIPRIAMPPITDHEANNLEPEDLAACGGAVLDFLLTAAEREAMLAMLQG